MAGLAIFSVETFFIVRSGQGVLDFDASGTARAAVIAARPALEILLVRIAVAYAVAGAAAALTTGILADDVARTRKAFRLLWAADALALCLFAAWAACIARPALFEDVDALRPLVLWIASHGAPWQPALATAAVCALHLPRSRRRARTALRTAVAMSLVLLPHRPASSGAAAERPAPLVVLIGLDAFRPDRIEGAAIVVFSDHGEGFQPAFPKLSSTVPIHGARLSDDENRILLAFKPPAGSGIAGGRTSTTWCA
jgi:hypothetical protein